MVDSVLKHLDEDEMRAEVDKSELTPNHRPQ